jgi:hypothetical protein
LLFTAQSYFANAALVNKFDGVTQLAHHLIYHFLLLHHNLTLAGTHPNALL